MHLAIFRRFAMTFLAASALTTQVAPANAAALRAPSAEGRAVLPDDVKPVSYDIAITPDSKTLSFTGRVTIDIDVKRPTRTIELNAADLKFAHVSLDGSSEAPATTLDPVEQTATFTFSSPVTAGQHSLSIAYTGKIYRQSSGLFALDYTTPSGKARALFTQFENSDARRFIPSFDEPGSKATFRLSATVPADLMAVSNMPIAASTPLPGGLKRVQFAETPKMSTYLLFFGLGDFERVSRKIAGVDVGVIVKRGETADTSYALYVASQVLPYYNTYFGTLYPLPKLDMIAGPGQSQSFDSMENWGANFYFEEALLIDPKTATEADKQRIYILVAHEIAHQWFGDLVTMAWWDDLWLNEGFATWMSNKVADHFHPKWKVWLQTEEREQVAMSLDAKADSHPVILPVKDVQQAAAAIDAITYYKGSAVIRMLENYTGEDAWRAGVRRYMARYAYGNTVTGDLWREIDAASPRKVTEIANDFTLQPGVPMATVRDLSCSGAAGGVHLTSGQFRVPMGPPTGTWMLPLSAATASSSLGQRLVLTGAEDLQIACPAVVNAGQTSYMRTLYSGKAAVGMATAYDRLSADDQLGILYDTYAEGAAGYAPMADYMRLTGRVAADANPLVWTLLAGQLSDIDRLYDGLPGQAVFRTYALSRLEPQAARLGWDAQPSEPTNTDSERTAVISTLSAMGDPQVVAQARKRFAILAGGGTLKPSTRSAVLKVAAVNADPATWAMLHHLALTAPTQLQKSEYYRLLGRARDPAVAEKALRLAISGEPEPTVAPLIISAVSYLHPALALDFTVAHWAVIAPLLDTHARTSLPTRLIGGGNDIALADTLQRFADAHIAPSDQGEVGAAKAALAERVDFRRRGLPEIDRWLANDRHEGR